MPRACTLDRLSRLDALEALLKSGAPMTTAGLAEELGISSRSLFRDLALLRQRGLPVEADRGRGGGVRLTQNWGVGRLALTYREALALQVSLTMAERLGAPWMLGDLSPVRRKLANSFAPPFRQRIGTLRARILLGGPASAAVTGGFALPDAAAAEVLAETFVEQRRLSFSYVDGSGRASRRRVEPHYLLFNPPVWYLLAWDDARDAVRTFRLDRIRKALPDPGPAFRLRPPGDFAAAVEGAAAAPV